MREQLIILGSGPAGYTAAVYAARAGIRTMLIEGRDPGGQLMITTEVENYPGFPKGIAGPDLMIAMREQTERFGVKIVAGAVSKIKLGKKEIKVETDERSFECEALIIATGATARWLGIPSESALRGKGVSACATCDGFFFKGRDVAVIGGGDTAIEEALYLSHMAKSVKLIHRRDRLRASAAMRERAEASSKISFVWNSVVSEIKDVSQGKVTSLVLKDVKSGKFSELPCEGVFVAIGHVPNTKVFEGHLKLDENGYIVVQPGSTRTSAEGVFAAGDVADPVYRQAVTAAGSGCMAAIDAERWLLGRK